MKREWDVRAAQNARRYIASEDSQSEEVFDASGRRDTQILLSDLPYSNAKDKTVLDIGCGIGRMERYLSSLFRQVYGIDISVEMIKRAKQRLGNYKNVHFQNCNGRSLKMFHDDMFDFVFSYSTFQHIPGYMFWSYCKESFRVLKPGGIFKFQIFEKTLSFRKAAAFLIKRDIPNALRSLLPIPDSDYFWVVRTWPQGKNYLKGELRERLRKIGFVDIDFSRSVFREKYVMLWVAGRKPLRAHYLKV